MLRFAKLPLVAPGCGHKLSVSVVTKKHRFHSIAQKEQCFEATGFEESAPTLVKPESISKALPGGGSFKNVVVHESPMEYEGYMLDMDGVLQRWCTVQDSKKIASTE